MFHPYSCKGLNLSQLGQSHSGIPSRSPSGSGNATGIWEPPFSRIIRKAVACSRRARHVHGSLSQRGVRLRGGRSPKSRQYIPKNSPPNISDPSTGRVTFLTSQQKRCGEKRFGRNKISQLFGSNNARHFVAKERAGESWIGAYVECGAPLCGYPDCRVYQALKKVSQKPRSRKDLSQLMLRYFNSDNGLLKKKALNLFMYPDFQFYSIGRKRK